MLKKITYDLEILKIAVFTKSSEKGTYEIDCFETLLQELSESLCEIQMNWFDVDSIEDRENLHELCDYQGIVLLGREGKTGLEGMIQVAQFARENQIPFMAFNQGMQMAVVEIARNLVGLTDAYTDEFDSDSSDIFYSAHFASEEVISRIGEFPMIVQEKSPLAEIIDNQEIILHHQHQVEMNLIFQGPLLEAGLLIEGTSPNGVYIEAVSFKNHPFYHAFIAEPFWLQDSFDGISVYQAFLTSILSNKNKQ